MSLRFPTVDVVPMSSLGGYAHPFSVLYLIVAVIALVSGLIGAETRAQAARRIRIPNAVS